MEKLILECVLRSALIALFTAVALFVLRVKAARVRHAVWAGVVVSMLALPVWTVWGPKAMLRVLKPAPVAVEMQPVIQTLQQDFVTAAPVARRLEWNMADSLPALYLLGFGVLMARLLTGTVRAGTLVRRSRDCEGRLTSDACVAPITVGALNPVVILPAGWTQWTQAQLDAVLAHEGEHARRWDPLVQWLALFNRAVFWFHPLAWWLSRRLSALSEEACDDAVLAGGHDAVQYSECLLGLARAVQESGARLTAMGMAMPGAFLPQRIRRIVTGVPVQRVSRGRKFGVAVACVATSTLFTVGAIGYAQESAQTPAPIVVQSTPVAPAEVVAAQVSEPAASPAAAPGPSAPSTLRWKPSWQGTRGMVLQGHVTRGGVEIAQTTTTIPGKPTDGFGAGFQTLSGVVMDPAGAVVPNATVGLVNTDTKAAISPITTDTAGRYMFQHMDVGTYDLTISAPGFKRETQTGIHVAAGEAHNGGTTMLQLGAVRESITVTGSRSAALAAGPTVAVLGPVTTLTPAATLATVEQTQAVKKQFVEQFWLRRDASAGSAGPIKVGGNVQAANLINAVKPVYPVEPLSQGIQGTVKIEALISKGGTADNLQVISSPDATLTQAALNAVKLWRYRPTMLDGEPVETMTTIDVNYSATE